ncbi:MAG TPA: Gfo/Idh/MocA family oxidoreductase [Candidatus Hydrogenedentes bacterium]|nr:Gfo/Idh/MocA family oxidoreductase [Candidatus Hydrogenedentota bacterium]
MVNVGIIGQGFIGKMHLAVLRKSKLATVVAVADKNPTNLKDEAATGNIAIEGDISLDGVSKYEEGDALLKDAHVEAVLITLPTFLHKEYILKSIAAGKHVLCEKPLVLSKADGLEVLDALKGYDRVFMAAQCIRFWPVYVKAREIIQSQEYGALLAAHLTRQSGKPSWSFGGWLLDETKSGGAALDLHVHDVDFVNYLLGEPDRIQATGVDLPGEGVSQINALYTYNNGPVASMDGGWLHGPTFPFRMGFRMELEKAALEFNSMMDGALHVYTEAGEHLTPELLPGDGYSREHDYFLSCVEEGKPANEATAESAIASVALVEREREAVRS